MCLAEIVIVFSALTAESSARVLVLRACKTPSSSSAPEQANRAGMLRDKLLFSSVKGAYSSLGYGNLTADISDQYSGKFQKALLAIFEPKAKQDNRCCKRWRVARRPWSLAPMRCFKRTCTFIDSV